MEFVPNPTRTSYHPYVCKEDQSQTVLIIQKEHFCLPDGYGKVVRKCLSPRNVSLFQF